MARLFPFRSEPAETEGQPRVVDLEGEDADAVFSALSSTTARRIYARLDDEPGTPSDVADAIDSSIQNVRYHLENLEDAGLVEVVDTWYSSRGNEMSVYATTDGPLIVTSDESTATRLREALSRFVGGIGALAGGSLLVQYGLTRWAESVAESPSGGTTSSGTADGDGADGSSAGDGESADGPSAGDAESADGPSTGDNGGDDFETQTSPDDGAETTGGDNVSLDTEPTGGDVNGTAESVGDGGTEVAEVLFETVPPGALFFLGGLLVLTLVTVYWYWYRPSY